MCVLDAGDLIFPEVRAEIIMFLMPVGAEAMVKSVGVPREGRERGTGDQVGGRLEERYNGGPLAGQEF